MPRGVRMALHWLEKAEHLDQLGMVADLMTVELFSENLSEIGKEQSTLGAVAQAILSVASEMKEVPSAQSLIPSSSAGDGLLSGLLHGLSDMIGVRVDWLQNPPPSNSFPHLFQRL